MSYEVLNIQTHGEGFTSITEKVQSALPKFLPDDSSSGVVYLFVQHTSCALTISEDYDPSAKSDMEAFLKQLAPRDASFIQHRLEGPDDSPSHMKSILLNQHLALPVENGELLLGTWQGIFLAEFRDRPHERKILLKFVSEK